MTVTVEIPLQKKRPRCLRTLAPVPKWNRTDPVSGAAGSTDNHSSEPKTISAPQSVSAERPEMHQHMKALEADRPASAATKEKQPGADSKGEVSATLKSAAASSSVGRAELKARTDTTHKVDVVEIVDKDDSAAASRSAGRAELKEMTDSTHKVDGVKIVDKKDTSLTAAQALFRDAPWRSKGSADKPS